MQLQQGLKGVSSLAFSLRRRAEDREPIRVLVVSPDERVRAELREKLRAPRWQVIEAPSGAEALEALQRQSSEALLLDPQLPDIVANEFSALVLKRFPAVEILTLDAQTGHTLIGNTSPTALAARLTDSITTSGHLPPPKPPSTVPFAENAQTSFASATPYRNGLREMVGGAPAMQRLYSMTEMVAGTATTVLVTGESGTGKDLVARAIHMLSPRARHPFAVVNCAAIPEALLEAELFGYAKGAFTGAVQSRIGRIHAAHGGTLFLDEIGDMPLSLQGKILRFLEQGEVQRLGGNDNLKVDVRVIAATNANLKTMAANKTFREDLYYRLAVFPIHLPPLRDRVSDIVQLAETFAAKFCPGARIDPAVFTKLEEHGWPGNVRELRNVLERAAVLLRGGALLTPEHILL